MKHDGVLTSLACKLALLIKDVFIVQDYKHLFFSNSFSKIVC